MLYQTAEELFAETILEIEAARAVEEPDAAVRNALNFNRCTAAAATLLATQYDALDHLTEHQVLVFAQKLGFDLAVHEEVRVILRIAKLYSQKWQVHVAAQANAAIENFDATFFQDREGRLMARFSIGNLTFNPIPMDEEWEVRFVRSYHDAIQLSAAHGFGKRA